MRPQEESGSLSAKFEDKQRQERIVAIKAMLPFIRDDEKKAELHGELATLQRQEHEWQAALRAI